MNFFKAIGNAVTAPFKSVGDIVTGKGNLGDVLSIAGAFAPGGNFTTNLADLGTKNFGLNSLLGGAGLTPGGGSGLMGGMPLPGFPGGGFGKPLDKWQTGDFVNAALALSQSGMLGGGGGGGGGRKMSGDPNKDIASMMLPLVQSDILFALANQPKTHQARMDAASALDPANQAGMYQQMLQQAISAATAAGTKQGAQLKSQGYGDSVQAGAVQGATNAATSNVNQQMVNTPEGIAQANMQIAQLLGMVPSLGGFSQAENLSVMRRNADAQYNATRPPTLLENVFSIAGTTLPYILNSDGKTKARQGWSKDQEDAVGNFARIQGMF